MVRQDEISEELESLAGQLVRYAEAMDALYAMRLRLWQEGQALDPKMSQAQLAVPSGVTEGAVTQALRKVRLKELTPR